jgi:hypothetical protein
MWVKQGDITGWLIEGTGTDPRNMTPTAQPHDQGRLPVLGCALGVPQHHGRVIVETAGQRYPFYVKTFTEDYKNGAWTGN